MHTITDMSEDQLAIRDAVERTCAQFGDEYWARTDETGDWPEAFCDAMAEGGWLGVAFPEEYGGAGLGLTEASLVMQTVTRSGAGYSGASAIHLNIFGPKPLEKFGTPEQKQENLPKIISGEEKMCFAVTEPNSGLDTSSLQTRAERTNSGYVINGRKIWTTGAQRADKILIIARTTPKEECSKPISACRCSTQISTGVRSRPSRSRKWAARRSSATRFSLTGWKCQGASDRRGGRGFQIPPQGLNPERVLFAVESIGLGFAALERAAQYANERIMFGRPIGQNQGVAHPLAKAWAELSAAELLAYQAAALFDDRARNAGPRRMPRNISAARRASMPARRRCSAMAAWVMRRSIMSNASCAKPCWRGLRLSAVK